MDQAVQERLPDVANATGPLRQPVRPTNDVAPIARRKPMRCLLLMAASGWSIVSMAYGAFVGDLPWAAGSLAVCCACWLIVWATVRSAARPDD